MDIFHWLIPTKLRARSPDPTRSARNSMMGRFASGATCRRGVRALDHGEAWAKGRRRRGRRRAYYNYQCHEGAVDQVKETNEELARTFGDADDPPRSSLESFGRQTVAELPPDISTTGPAPTIPMTGTQETADLGRAFQPNGCGIRHAGTPDNTAVSPTSAVSVTPGLQIRWRGCRTTPGALASRLERSLSASARAGAATSASRAAGIDSGLWKALQPKAMQCRGKGRRRRRAAGRQPHHHFSDRKKATGTIKKPDNDGQNLHPAERGKMEWRWTLFLSGYRSRGKQAMGLLRTGGL